MTSTYHVRHQIVANILCEDLADIVDEYIGIHHRKEWTKNLMIDVLCGLALAHLYSKIDYYGVAFAIHCGKYVKYMVNIPNINTIRRHISLYSHVITPIRVKQWGQEINFSRLGNAIYDIARPSTYNHKPSTIKKPQHIHCQFCYRKNEPIFPIHRVYKKTAMMCRRCDTQKRYTVLTTTGFRKLPFDIQEKIISKMDTYESLKKRYDSLTRDERLMSYSTFCRWYRDRQMH